MIKILVTGGSGYIGKHVCLLLLEEGYDVIVIDNEYNSKLSDLDIVENMSRKKISKFNIDINDRLALNNLFQKFGPFNAVIHLAALKSVTESNNNPNEYIKVNVVGGLKLIKVMKEYNCDKIVLVL